MAVLLLAWKPVRTRWSEGSKPAIAGALLAYANTASEYGFGAVIASFPGFLAVSNAMMSIPDPLAGITGSASGGLAALSDTFIHNAEAAGIPVEVRHRVAASASGGMDRLPHNGAVITLLAVTT